MTPVPFNPALHVPDVNHWGGIIDQETFHAAGVRRAITKLTEGAHFGDPLAGFCFRKWRELGIAREAYHFVTTWDDGAEQVRVFNAGLYGVHWQPSEPIWLDLEARSLSAAWRALSVVGLRRKLKPLVLQMTRTTLNLIGVMPGWYCGATFWNRNVGPIDWLAEGLPQPKLWSPDYGRDRLGGGIAGPRWIDPRTWPLGWSRWQFTDRGIVPGVRGFTDLNVERGA